MVPMGSLGGFVPPERCCPHVPIPVSPGGGPALPLHLQAAAGRRRARPPGSSGLLILLVCCFSRGRFSVDGARAGCFTFCWFYYLLLLSFRFWALFRSCSPRVVRRGAAPGGSALSRGDFFFLLPPSRRIFFFLPQSKLGLFPRVCVCPISAPYRLLATCSGAAPGSVKSPRGARSRAGMERDFAAFCRPGEKKRRGAGRRGGGKREKEPRRGGSASLPASLLPGARWQEPRRPRRHGRRSEGAGRGRSGSENTAQGGGSERFYSFPFQRCRRKQRGSEGGGQGVPPAARG